MDLYLVEFSKREDDPWEPDCIFPTNEAAEEYIAEYGEDDPRFCITEIPLRGDFKSKEFAYLMEFVKESESLDESLTINQLRSLWTAFAFHQNLDVDTKTYNSFMYLLWSEVNRKRPMSHKFINQYHRFYRTMSQYLP